MFLEQQESVGDVLAESRAGKEDRRLKDSFAKLWLGGTQYVSPNRFQKVITSKQLKVKSKANNISGLQLADMLAHPSRNEILLDHKMRSDALAPFAEKIVGVLKDKYYRVAGKV